MLGHYGDVRAPADSTVPDAQAHRLKASCADSSTSYLFLLQTHCRTNLVLRPRADYSLCQHSSNLNFFQVFATGLSFPSHFKDAVLPNAYAHGNGCYAAIAEDPSS